MKNLLNDTDKDEIMQRLSRLQKESQPLWGKMDASQMICHLSDQLRIGLGRKEAKMVSNALRSSLIKWLVFYAVGFPKNSETLREMKQQNGEGTPPINFNDDKDNLILLIQEFANYKKDFHPHPYFGKLSRREWGRVAFQHLDHHLKQFGV